MATLHLYATKNYSFGTKQVVPNQKEGNEMDRHRKKFAERGMRRTAEGVLVVQDHNTPMLLLIQDGNDFRLPGGQLRPGEGEIEGLKRKLTKKLAPPPSSGEPTPDWAVGELLATWWRPKFEAHQYPYLPVHCSKAKECRKLFYIPLRPHTKFALASPKGVSKAPQLVAVPFFELYDNSSRFGPIITSIPQLISRFTLTFNDADLVAEPIESAQADADAEMMEAAAVADEQEQHDTVAAGELEPEPGAEQTSAGGVIVD